jgi:hypothetical protein
VYDCPWRRGVELMVGGMKERAPVGSSGSLLVEESLVLELGRPIVVTISVLYELML